jgi:hypothetical protein
VRLATPVVLATLILTLATNASANTQWFYEGQPIAEGTTVAVASSGKIALALKLPKQTTIKISCPASGIEAFWNTPTNGRDETRTISFACPEGTSVTPALPWGSTLLESIFPLHDRWESVALHLVYNGVDYGTFTGSLDTTVGDVDPQKDRETFVKDELDHFLIFHGGLTKALTGPNEAKVWFAGSYVLGGKTSRVTDESGVWK